jgi:regulator of cell morphogenesis and NO signaling
MTAETTQTTEPAATSPLGAAALIAHVLERFHETHRRELPTLLQWARELQALGAAPDTALHLQAMAAALESHMFKEEMRLFPMMEQGGSSLIGHLIDDMEAEHRAHEAAIARLRSLLAGLAAPAGAQAQRAALQAAGDKLIDDLTEHIRVEDEVLFAMFRP